MNAVSVIDRRRSWGTLGSYWNVFQAKGVYREDTAALAYGTSVNIFSQTFDVGMSLKMLRHAYVTDSYTSDDPVFRGGNSKSAVGVDLGLQWEPLPSHYPGLRLSVVGKNLNAPDVGLSQKDQVPAEGRLGLALEDTPLLAFTPVFEVSRRRGETEVAGGMEKWFLNRTLALRAGGNAREGASGFSYVFRTAGADVRVDYAFSWPLYVSDTAGTHRLSVAVGFGASKTGVEHKRNR
jgi:hypothetical protein